MSVDAFSAVLLDVDIADLPNGGGLAALLLTEPTLPILVVGRDEDPHTARRAIQSGAFEYLVSSHLDNYWLPRAVHHAVEWKRLETELSNETERAGITLNSLGDTLISADSSGRRR